MPAPRSGGLLAAPPLPWTPAGAPGPGPPARGPRPPPARSPARGRPGPFSCPEPQPGTLRERWRTAPDAPGPSKEEEEGSAADGSGFFGVVKVEPNPETVRPENFKEDMRDLLAGIFRQHGGPQQYLTARFGTEHSREQFAQDLQKLFPPKEDMEYYSGAPAIPDHDKEFLISLWDLGFAARCSTKPPPYAHTARSLGDEFVTNTFLTERDPLLLAEWASVPACPDPASPHYFWTSYVKGMARATTVLVVADLIMRYNIQVHRGLPGAVGLPPVHQGAPGHLCGRPERGRPGECAPERARRHPPGS